MRFHRKTCIEDVADTIVAEFLIWSRIPNYLRKFAPDSRARALAWCDRNEIPHDLLWKWVAVGFLVIDVNGMTLRLHHVHDIDLPEPAAAIAEIGPIFDRIKNRQ